MQLADGTANLDIFYTHQFVQNESTTTDTAATSLSAYQPAGTHPDPRRNHHRYDL